MRTGTKILWTVITFIIGAGLLVVVQVLTEPKITRWLYAIIAVGMVTALSVIWKKKPDK
jgi:hypothetical protein